MAIQDKFNSKNVIYKITSDVDLEGGTLTVPAGCTLDFQGGSINNGTVRGNGAYVSGETSGCSAKFEDVVYFTSGQETALNGIVVEISNRMAEVEDRFNDSLDDMNLKINYIDDKAAKANSTASKAEAKADSAISTSNEAANTATIAKNAVATLEGLADADEAQQTLAAQVVQIEENKQNIALNKAETDEKLTELATDVAELQSVVNAAIPSQYNLNKNLVGADNMIWSWWYHPQLVSLKKVRDKVYWGYTTSDGYTGIAEYDIQNRSVKKTHLKLSEIDDHNAAAVIPLFESSKIMVVYAGGHNTDKAIHVRVSSSRECIENFVDEVILESKYVVSYAQIVRYKDSGWYYLFYRVNNSGWAWRRSKDGKDWSEEKVFVMTDMQYYCKFVETTESGIIRVCMYSNPGVSGGDTNIRMGYINLNSEKVYNSDFLSEIGTIEDTFSHTDFNIIIANQDGYDTQRMLDIAVSSPSDTKVLFAKFNTTESSDGVYMLYDKGTISEIANAGMPLWIPKYQHGASWVDSDRFVLGRESNGIDFIELYRISDNGVTLIKEIYSEEIGVNSIRNARPIADYKQKYIMWFRGYYNSTSYTDYESDAKLYDIEADNILI